MAAIRFFLLLVAISFTAVCAHPLDDVNEEISNFIPLGDEADVPATIRVDATRTEKPEVVKDEYTELVSITEESTTTTAPPRTSFFSRLIDDIAKIPGTVLKAFNSFIHNLGFRSQSSSSSK